MFSKQNYVQTGRFVLKIGHPLYFTRKNHHTIERDVPNSDFSNRDERTVSLVPSRIKLGTKGQDINITKIDLRDMNLDKK